MIKDIQNRIDIMFPNLSNRVENVENTNTLSSTELWQGLSDKFADKVKKIITPLDGIIMDCKTDLQVPNPDALPVVQVEVVNSVGDALIDTTTWDGTALNSTYVDVKLHRVSRPFSLSAYDLQRGERVESKVRAAAEKVAQGVIGLLATAMEDVDPEYISDFGVEAAAAMSGVFDSDETNALILSPANYAKIVPTNAIGLNPAVEGSFGINHIYKSTLLGDVLALTKDAIAGAICTPAVLENHGGTGMDIRAIEVAGIPMVVKAQFDFNETLKCSVETMAGFVVANSNGIKKYTIGEEPETEDED